MTSLPLPALAPATPGPAPAPADAAAVGPPEGAAEEPFVAVLRALADAAGTGGAAAASAAEGPAPHEGAHEGAEERQEPDDDRERGVAQGPEPPEYLLSLLGAVAAAPQPLAAWAAPPPAGEQESPGNSEPRGRIPQTPAEGPVPGQDAPVPARRRDGEAPRAALFGEGEGGARSLGLGETAASPARGDAGPASSAGAPAVPRGHPPAPVGPAASRLLSGAEASPEPVRPPEAEAAPPAAPLPGPQGAPPAGGPPSPETPAADAPGAPPAPLRAARPAMAPPGSDTDPPAANTARHAPPSGPRDETAQGLPEGAGEGTARGGEGSGAASPDAVPQAPAALPQNEAGVEPAPRPPRAAGPSGEEERATARAHEAAPHLLHAPEDGPAVAARPARDAQEGAGTPAPPPGLSPAGLRAVTEALRAAARGGMEVRLRLHPDTLGEVQVRVRWDAGGLSARLDALTPAAREALEGGLPHLRAALHEQGVPVERLQVGMGLDLEARSREQGPWTRQAPPERFLAPAGLALRAAPPAEAAAPAPGRVDLRI